MIGREIAAIGVPEEAVRLLVAAVLGAMIAGPARRARMLCDVGAIPCRAAGLRTHALVCVASALVMIGSAYGFAGAVTASRTVVLDPSRIAAQVVSGVGFLSAGAIILRKDTVQGLTAAATTLRP